MASEREKKPDCLPHAQGLVYIHDQGGKQKEGKTKGKPGSGVYEKTRKERKQKKMTNDEKAAYHSLMRYSGEVERRTEKR